MEDDQDSEVLSIQLGLEQLMFLTEVTKKLNDMGVKNTAGLILNVSIVEETTKELVGVWDNDIDENDWQLILR